MHLTKALKTRTNCAESILIFSSIGSNEFFNCIDCIKKCEFGNDDDTQKNIKFYSFTDCYYFSLLLIIVDIGASADLEVVDKFCCLGDMLSVDGDADAVVEARLRIGLHKFRQLVPLLTTTTTVLQPFFRDHQGEPVPEENFWTLWCKGRLREADTPAIRLGATASGPTSARLHHPLHFFTGRMPFLPPNQKCQSTEDNHCLPIGIYHWLGEGGCVLSSMLHGSDTWPVRKENEVALQQAEMRICLLYTSPSPRD